MTVTNPNHVFVGAETGLLKGVNIEKRSWSNINTVKEINRKKEVEALCWVDEDQTKICVGLRDNVVQIYDATDGNVVNSYTLDSGVGKLRGLARWQTKWITCRECGSLKVWDEDNKVHTQIDVGANLSRMQSNPEQPHIIATGGKQNELKIWDLHRHDTPSFAAKNVKHDWLNLEVPVWVTDMAFIPGSQKITTCTGHHQVRLYDPSTPQRRPVLDMEFGEYPLTCMSLCVNNNQIIVGNTHGQMALLDIRGKGHMVQQYKGFAGGIRSVQCHPNQNMVASCGLDRYLRIHDLNSRELLHKYYMKSRLNCLLFASNLPTESSEGVKPQGAALEKAASGSASDEESDHDVWEEMPVVQTHPAKRKAKHTHHFMAPGQLEESEEENSVSSQPKQKSRKKGERPSTVPKHKKEKTSKKQSGKLKQKGMKIKKQNAS